LSAARVKNGGVLGYTRSVLGIDGASGPWQGRAAHVPAWRGWRYEQASICFPCLRVVSASSLQPEPGVATRHAITFRGLRE
jgi:hypothetical protein